MSNTNIALKVEKNVFVIHSNKTLNINPFFYSKIVQLIKSLKKLSESEYESDQCLDYLKKIDNSFNDEKSCRNEIAKAMIDSNYPGN
jgi:hypothetical protein